MKISNKMQSKNGLNIIIVGCGKVGMTLIEQLSKEGHDITIIDKNAAKVHEMSNLYDIMGLVGNGASYSVQMEAGIENADLIIAVTASDELNLLCCTVAKQVGDCAAIARVRTPDYSKEAGYLREKLGLTMIINPELEASLETARILYLPTALEVNSFAHGQAEIVKFKIPDGNLLDGMTIATLGKSMQRAFLNRGHLQFSTAPLRLVRLCHNRRYRMSCRKQCFQRSDCKIRRSHIYYLHLVLHSAGAWHRGNYNSNLLIGFCIAFQAALYCPYSSSSTSVPSISS